jgi:hypothetical protein
MEAIERKEFIRGDEVEAGQQILFKLRGEWQVVTLTRPLLSGSVGYGRRCWQIAGHMLPITLECDGCYRVVES